jgi:hypothetical protein
MMARSHFSQLAHLPGQGIISICRHGLVHLTWENVTIRLERGVFQRLGRLVERAMAISSPVPIYDDDLSVDFDRSHFRVTIPSIEWTLSTESFLAFRGMIKEALKRLELLVASGRWEEEDEAEPLTLMPFDELEGHSFSLN